MAVFRGAETVQQLRKAVVRGGIRRAGIIHAAADLTVIPLPQQRAPIPGGHQFQRQKAVCILLSLLALGVKNIYLGPTLPAFLSETVVKVLVDTYGLQPITAPEQDLDAILGRG